MSEEEEKRNSTAGIDQVAQVMGAQGGGVGGRQGHPTPSPGGGGYPKNCTILNFQTGAEKKRDPRLDELNEMGLQKVWLRVAEAVGVDAFLQVWRILDSDKSNATEDGRRLVPMRSYSCYERYQRNRYIESLVKLGLSDQEISDVLSERIGEAIKKRHICNIRHRG